MDVRVKTAGGTSGTSEADEFTYRGEPTVTAITPDEGPIAGGPSVKITGTNFTSSSEVKFGANASEHVEFKNSGELVAKIPAGSGTVDVRVKTAGGTSPTGVPDEFTYRAIPTVSAVSPDEGPVAGGPTVTITGTNFTSSSEVKFGANARERRRIQELGRTRREDPRRVAGPSTSRSRPPAAPRRRARRISSPTAANPPSPRSNPERRPDRGRPLGQDHRHQLHEQ